MPRQKINHELVCKLLSLEYPIMEIATKLGCSDRQIKRIKRKYNIDVPSTRLREIRARIRHHDSLLQEAVQWAKNENISYREIGTMFAISHQTAFNIGKETL